MGEEERKRKEAEKKKPNVEMLPLFQPYSDPDLAVPLGSPTLDSQDSEDLPPVAARKKLYDQLQDGDSMLVLEKDAPPSSLPSPGADMNRATSEFEDAIKSLHFTIRATGSQTSAALKSMKKDFPCNVTTIQYLMDSKDGLQLSD